MGRKFIDHLRLFVKAGSGAYGYPAKSGKGGDGGNVIFVAKERYRMKQLLSKFPTKRIMAAPGTPAGKKRIVGEKGADLVVEVPTGVELSLDDGQILGDLNVDGEEKLVAVGGKGGGPFNGYSSRPGEALSITLDLKIIADLGLVGFPNAGKSTLLRAVSRATPKIASYPFTTLNPMIATMDYKDGRQITMADLPGLIEGAHVNVGLGHHFLKHIERTKCLLFVLDATGFHFKENTSYRSVEETALLLNRELELYKSHLLEKPAVCVINKVDLLRDQNDLLHRAMDNLCDLHHFVKSCSEPLDKDVIPSNIIKFKEVIGISAEHNENIDHLKLRLRHWLNDFALEECEHDFEKSDKAMLDQFKSSSVENFRSLV